MRFSFAKVIIALVPVQLLLEVNLTFLHRFYHVSIAP
jgi:hypothetical protein